MSHPLEDENRRLKEMLRKFIELAERDDIKWGPLRADANAALAEPASGGARIAHYTRDDQGRIVIDGLTFCHYDAPPSPPPTQGEEETALDLGGMSEPSVEEIKRVFEFCGEDTLRGFVEILLAQNAALRARIKP